MVTIEYGGRLANNIVQLIAGYFFAKRHGLSFDPDLGRIDSESGCDSGCLIRKDVFPLPGDTFAGNVVAVNDENFWVLYNEERLPGAHYLLSGYFQKRTFLESIRPRLHEVLVIERRPGHEEDVFVHYRIGDLLLYQRDSERIYTPRQFFNEALKSLRYRKGYISTDSPDHPDYLYLVRKFGLEEVRMPPLETILFGKDFGRLVLSEYSFSGLIGYLSDTEEVWCNRRSLWSLGEGTMLNGFDRYRLGRWTYRDGYPFNEAHSHLNGVHAIMSRKSPHLERVRRMALDCDTVCEVSCGTGRETVSILAGYPDRLWCLYSRPPAESGTDPAYLRDRAAEAMVVMSVEVGGPGAGLPPAVDMLVCTCSSHVDWPKLLGLMQRVRKYIVLDAGKAMSADSEYLQRILLRSQPSNLPLRLHTLGFDLSEQDGHWFFTKRP